MISLVMLWEGWKVGGERQIPQEPKAVLMANTITVSKNAEVTLVSSGLTEETTLPVVSNELWRATSSCTVRSTF